MFEKTIVEDLLHVTSEAEREEIGKKIFYHFREQFLEFIEELKKSNIAQTLANSSNPEETISIWEEYSSRNQDFINKIINWAVERDEYFYDREHMPLFMKDEELEPILEIGLFIVIVNDECLFSSEDIVQGFDESSEFDEKLYTILKDSSNPLIRAAGWHIDCSGYEITAETIYNFSD